MITYKITGVTAIYATAVSERTSFNALSILENTVCGNIYSLIL